MLWVTDIATTMVHVRPEWEALTGQRPGDALGHGWVSRVHPDDRTMVLEALQSATHTKQAFCVQNRLRRNEGGYRWVTSGGSPSIAPESGRFLGYLGTLTVLPDTASREASAAVGLQPRPAEVLDGVPLSTIDDLADQVIYARELAYQAKETGVLNILDLALAEIGFRIAQGDRAAALLNTLKSRLS